MNDFELKIAEVLEVDSVSPEDQLENFECWDSLTILSIIALADESCGVTLSAPEVTAAKTVGGLKDLITKKM